MKIHPAKRLLSLVLALVMVLGLVPVSAGASGLTWQETALDIQPDLSHRLVADGEAPDLCTPADTVRVSIVLEDAPTAGAGFQTRGIAMDQQAVAYDQALNRAQKIMEQTISAQALGGKKLDVVWNLTLIANIISANVPYGRLDAIRAVPGVRAVYLERQYSPHTAKPTTSASGGMTGAAALWSSGYTGAGSRIAVVDTGTDTDHQSFDNGAFLHALKQNAAQEGISYDSYLESIDLLDIGDVNDVLRQLNVTERIGYDDASAYYLNEKLPFAANYVDRNLVVDHDHDYQGSHGSHVAGIAAANRFIPQNGSYTDALEAVSVAGAAPDAQIITMKVFGNADGPYDSDYFAAIEDAIWLGCDSVNLSLGTGSPGSSHSGAFEYLMERLEATDTVVVMSAGNSGQWADNTAPGRLYADDVSFHTSGEPGTYTNSLAVASVDSDSSAQATRDDYTLSSFSSWGVPGSLELKPEITAPGGGILSIDGVDTSGRGYEYMSGTSMAAPQISGMTAQLAQYIREQSLETKTGLSARQLAQSLLMSTAVPLRETDGSCYPVLAQGAGFARVDLAASAESCVLVEGQNDGKVKVELGEDALREGTYTFSFTLHNLTGQPMTYDLRADLFTQDIHDGGNALYLSDSTRELTAQAVFTADGRPLAAGGSFSCDLNGDGVTDADDADHLLESLLDSTVVLHADGDVDGNGRITSYDAHLLLAQQTGGHTVQVQANSQLRVGVTLTLTDETRALLEREYPNGAYIEGYVYAEPAEGVTHSIPVLGWYGSWTEPGMFDVGGWVEHNAGAETRNPYLYPFHGVQSNYVSVSHGDGREYLFGGNPYVEEREYLPRRNALNNQQGDMLQNLRFTLIRSAFDSRLILKNVTTGETILSEDMGAFGCAYYDGNTGSWMDTRHRLALALDLTSIPENTTLELRLETAPELYRLEDGSADWASVKSGGILSTTFTIDNTAPQVLDIRQEDDRLLVRARDNQYIAAVALMNAAGTEALTIVPGDQTAPDTILEAALELSGIYGTKFLAAVYDYAGNHTVCEVELEPTAERPRFTAADQATGDWYGLNADGTRVKLADGSSGTILAAEYVDGYVFRVDQELRLWVGSDQDLHGFRLLSELDPEGEHEITKFNDLAYSTRDKLLYGSFYSDRNGQDTPYLCTIDLYTGQMTELGELSVDAHCMTIDGDGTFYAVGNGTGRLYTFRVDTVTTGEFSLVGNLTGYATTHSAPLAWDHALEELYWAYTNGSSTVLLKLDPETAAAEQVSSYPFCAAGLYIAGDTVGDTFAPTDQVTAVQLPETARTLAGSTVQLSALVLPWNIRDGSVTWSSSNPKVAAVDQNGLVTGVSGGTAVITAAARLDSTKKASCTVTVEALTGDMKALVWDELGSVWFSVFDPGSLPAYQPLKETDVPLCTAAYLNGTLYAGSLRDSVSDLYTVDPKTYAIEQVGGSQAIAYSDLCGAPKLGYLMATYFGYLAVVDPATGEYLGAWDWGAYVDAELVGITHLGSEYNQDYSAWVDVFLVLDNQGNVYREAIMPYGGSFATFRDPGTDLVGNMGAPVENSSFQGFHFDGSYLYWTRFSEAENIVELRVMDVLGDGTAHSLGYFPEGVWPVGGMYTDQQLGSNALTAEFAAQPIRAQSFPDPAAPIHGGGLNALEAEPDAGAKPFRMELTYDKAVTNGVLRVEYDESKLDFAGLAPGTYACAYRQEPGAVELAFAHGSAVPSGMPVAGLDFRAKEGVIGGETTVTIRTRELGQESVAMTRELTLAIPLPHNPFSDVPAGSFYHIPVLWAVQKGITSGVDATHFGPAAACNRAQVVTFLWAAAGRPEPKSTVNPFTDVPKGSFCEKAVLWAVETGITSGTDATHFSPLASCNRATVVTFLWAAKGKPAVTGTNPFTDVPAGSWYEKPVLWAKANGITSGISPTEFGAANICNRAQVVTFLYKAFGE